MLFRNGIPGESSNLFAAMLQAILFVSAAIRYNINNINII